jgi:hypothetical protein
MSKHMIANCRNINKSTEKLKKAQNVFFKEKEGILVAGKELESV